MKPWLRPHSKGTLLSLYIQPGASRNEISGEHDERLKLKIRALPQDGEANKELLNFVAELLEIAKKKVHLIQGETSRQKLVLVELPPEEVLRLFHLKSSIDLGSH